MTAGVNSSFESSNDYEQNEKVETTVGRTIATTTVNPIEACGPVMNTISSNLSNNFTTSSNIDEATLLQVKALEHVLPSNRFELELEFLQAMASPAYIHFLATTTSNIDNYDKDESLLVANSDSTTTNTTTATSVPSSSVLLLQDPSFQSFLIYLRNTWSQPQYSKYIIYPHSLYFLNLLIDHPTVVSKEWTLPQYRNFCHQQQFLSWQHRHSTCYGSGITTTTSSVSHDSATAINENGHHNDATTTTATTSSNTEGSDLATTNDKKSSSTQRASPSSSIRLLPEGLSVWRNDTDDN